MVGIETGLSQAYRRPTPPRKQGNAMKKTVLAILLSTATIVAGPIACTSANGDKAAYTLSLIHI